MDSKQETLNSDLQKLFARDPEKLSDQDLDYIIAFYREKRSIFNMNKAAPTKAAPKSKLKADIAGLAGQIDLGDLLK